jgi:hypothetical protein
LQNILRAALLPFLASGLLSSPLSPHPGPGTRPQLKPGASLPITTSFGSILAKNYKLYEKPPIGQALSLFLGLRKKTDITVGNSLGELAVRSFTSMPSRDASESQGWISWRASQKLPRLIACKRSRLWGSLEARSPVQ